MDNSIDKAQIPLVNKPISKATSFFAAFIWTLSRLVPGRHGQHTNHIMSSFEEVILCQLSRKALSLAKSLTGRDSNSCSC